MMKKRKLKICILRQMAVKTQGRLYGRQQKQSLRGSSQLQQTEPPPKKKKLPYHQKKLEKNNKQPEVSRRKETIKIREKINKFFLNGKKIKSRTI